MIRRFRAAQGGAVPASMVQTLDAGEQSENRIFSVCGLKEIRGLNDAEYLDSQRSSFRAVLLNSVSGYLCFVRNVKIRFPGFYFRF